MKSTYSEAFVEQAINKAFARGTRPITEISRELNVPYHTLRKWLGKSLVSKRGKIKTKERRPSDWSPEEQLQALHETHGLSDEALQAWCREKGLFAHNLTAWRTAFCLAAKSPAGASAESRTLKDENAKLKRELARKEKALAEAAALLILQKKYQALWEDEDK